MAQAKQDMGSGSVKKLMLQLMIPAVVAQVVNLLYNIVDRIYIGHIAGIGAAALTGVGLFTPILMLLNAFAMLVGAGGAPRTAIALGQGDKEQAEKIISNSFTMLLLFSVVLTIGFNYFAAYTGNAANKATSFEVDFSALADLVREDKIARVEFENGQILATPIDGYVYTDESGKEPKTYTNSEKTKVILYTTHILEQTTGGRLIQTYNTIGGVQADIHPDFVRRVKEFIAYMRPTLREYHEVFTGNVIARERLKGTGVLTREDAISFGATGGTGRASGWACDVRKRHPYAMYGKVDFEEVLYDEGDCFARYMVRMREIEQSMDIIEQLIDNIPEGEYQLKMKPVIRIPEGSYYAAVEGSRGEFGVFIESRGEKSPYRMKFRSTGLPLVSCLETIARGTKIADLIAIGGTLDYVVPDIDR